jgi:hypothetical protein
LRRTIVTIVLAAFAALAVAAPAGATTFCVPTYGPDCPNNGTNVPKATLDDAMTSNASDGIADTAIIAPGTLTDPGSFEPDGSDDLTVQGAGPDQTFLTTSSNSNIYVLNFAFNGNLRKITVKDLTIQLAASLPDNGGAAAQLSGDTLDNVDVESLNPGSSGVTSWIGGGTFRNGEIRASGTGSLQNAIQVDGNATSPVTIENAHVEDAVNGVMNIGAPAPLTIKRSVLVGGSQLAVGASNGTTNVENTVIFSPMTKLAFSATANSSSNVTINADHVTALSAGGNAPAVSSMGLANQAGKATVNIRNSILRGYGAAYQRQAGSLSGGADLTVAYSNFHVTGLETSTGTGALDVATGNIDADPLFTSADDLSLQAGSPSIDKGDPAAGGLTEDFLGKPRPVDGDAVAGAVRDQGAYEYQPPVVVDPPPDPPPADKTPPETTISKAPKKKTTKRSVTVAFSASEQGSTFRCSLDGKPAAPCTSPLKLKRLKRGKHVLAVTATDAAGNADASPATARFKVVKKRKKG